MDLLISASNQREDTPYPCLKQSEMQAILREQLAISTGLAQIEVSSKYAGKPSCSCARQTQARSPTFENQESDQVRDKAQGLQGLVTGSGITSPSSATLDSLKSQITILKQLAAKQQEEKLLFCYKYKQLHQKCMELMKQSDEKTSKWEKREAGCQTEQMSMIFGNISTSAIQCRCNNFSSFNQWMGAPSNSKVLAQSQQSPVSQFLGLSTGKSKVIGFDDGVEDVEDFEMRRSGSQRTASRKSQAHLILSKKKSQPIDGTAERELIELELGSMPQTTSKVSHELQLREQYVSSQMGLTSQPPSHSLVPSQINFYTEGTQGERAFGKRQDLHDQEFLEKCKSDTIALDEYNNSYLQLVKNYNMQKGSADSREQIEPVYSNKQAILVLDQQSARQCCEDQASFSQVTKGELQKCIKASRNPKVLPQAPSLNHIGSTYQPPTAYSNVFGSTPARSPESRLCIMHQTQEKPERTGEQSLDLDSDQKQLKLHRQRVLRQRLREMIKIGRKKCHNEDDERVFQSQILERALYCSSGETLTEEELPAMLAGPGGALILGNRNEILDSRSPEEELQLCQPGSGDEPGQSKIKKFTSYVTVLGNNVAAQGANASQDIFTTKDAPCSSIHSGTICLSQAMNSLKMIEQQIEEEQRQRREAKGNRNVAVIKVYDVKVSEQDDDKENKQEKIEDKTIDRKRLTKQQSRSHSPNYTSNEKLMVTEISRTDAPKGDKEGITRKSKESNIPVLEVDLYDNKRGSRATGTTATDRDNKNAIVVQKKEKRDGSEDLRVKRRERASNNKFKTVPNDENDEMMNKGSPANHRAKAAKPPVISTHGVKSPQKTHHPPGLSRAQNCKSKMLTTSILSKQSALNNYYRYKRHSRLGVHHTLLTGHSSIISGYRGGVNSVMDDSPFEVRDDKLCGCHQHVDSKTQYNFEPAQDQRSCTPVNLEQACSPQKRPDDANLQGSSSPITSAPRSSLRPSTNLSRLTRPNAPSTSNQDQWIFSPSKDFWKTKCQQLLYQKQKNAAEMLGQRERLDWCVREIERLKKVEEEQQEQRQQDNTLKEPIEAQREPNSKQDRQRQPGTGQSQRSGKQATKEEDSANEKVDANMLYHVDDGDFVLRGDDKQSTFEIQMERVDDRDAAERGRVGSSKGAVSIDLLCNEQLPDRADEDRSPPAFVTRSMDGSCLFPTSRGDSPSRKLSPTSVRISNLPSKIYSLTHSPRSPFGARQIDQDEAEAFDQNLLAKKIQRDQVKKQEKLINQRSHYSQLKRRQNNESGQSAPDCSRNLQGLFDQAAAQQTALEDQMNQLLCRQRPDEDTAQIKKRASYVTADGGGARTAVVPLRHPPHQRSEPMGGLSGSLSQSQQMFVTSPVMTSHVNSGSGKLAHTKTFCYQPVVRNNLQRVQQQQQQQQQATNTVQIVGVHLKSQTLSGCNGVLQDSSKEKNKSNYAGTDGTRRLSSTGQQLHQRQKTNGGHEYWASAAHPDIMSSNAPCSKLTPHPKVFGVESQSLLHCKMQNNVSSVKTKEGKPRQDLTRSKENLEPRQSAIRPPSDFLAAQALPLASFGGGRTDSAQDLNKTLSAGRTFFEQIKLKSSKQHVRRAEDRSQMDGSAMIPKERMSQDTARPDPRQPVFQKAANPSLMIMEDERKKQKAPLTPCYPSIKKSLFSLKHASILGSRKEQLFVSTTAQAHVQAQPQAQPPANPAVGNYNILEPHSATGSSRRYGSINLQQQDLGRTQAASAFGYSRENLPTPAAVSSCNAQANGRNSAQDPRHSPTSAGKQAFIINFHKDMPKGGDQGQKERCTITHHHNRSANASISNDQPSRRLSYCHSLIGSQVKTDAYYNATSKCLTRPYLAGVPRPSPVQQLQMGPQGTSKQLSRKTIENDSTATFINTTTHSSCQHAVGHQQARQHKGRN